MDTIRGFFSINNSNFSAKTDDGHLCLYSMLGKEGSQKIFQYDEPHPEGLEFQPGEMTVGNHRFCLFGQDGMILKGNEVLSLTYTVENDPYAYAVEQDGRVRVCCFKKEIYLWFQPVLGKIEIHTKRELGIAGDAGIRLEILPDSSGVYEVVVKATMSPSTMAPFEPVSYEESVKAAKQDFASWMKAFGDKPELEEAVYHLWCNMVPPGGYLKRPTMYMSKGGMCAVWTWDNVFNAAAMAKAFPKLALDQLLLSYDYMDEYGCIADLITGTTLSTTFTKPPVQGFLYRIMMQRNPYFAETEILNSVYHKMVRNTMWWLNYRSDPPCYWHGNDSGADNATCFDKTFMIASPDLTALLSVQCDFLSWAAEKLGLLEDVTKFRTLSDSLLQKTIDSFWDGEKFFVLAGDKQQPYYSGSLLPYRALVLADRMPKEIMDKIVHTLEKDYLGVCGLASEALSSPLFERKKYWRGSVWPPDQVIFEAALRKAGYIALADKIRNGFIKAMDTYGLGENFDAVTGEAQYCRGYSWTASAYILFSD